MFPPRTEKTSPVVRSQETQTEHPDLVQGLRRHLEENVNAKNVIKLLNSFLKYIDCFTAICLNDLCFFFLPRRTPILMERPSTTNGDTKSPNSLQ